VHGRWYVRHIYWWFWCNLSKVQIEKILNNHSIYVLLLLTAQGLVGWYFVADTWEFERICNAVVSPYFLRPMPLTPASVRPPLEVISHLKGNRVPCSLPCKEFSLYREKFGTLESPAWGFPPVELGASGALDP